MGFLPFHNAMARSDETLVDALMQSYPVARTPSEIAVKLRWPEKEVERRLSELEKRGWISFKTHTGTYYVCSVNVERVGNELHVFPQLFRLMEGAAIKTMLANREFLSKAASCPYMMAVLARWNTEQDCWNNVEPSHRNVVMHFNFAAALYAAVYQFENKVEGVGDALRKAPSYIGSVIQQLKTTQTIGKDTMAVALAVKKEQPEAWLQFAGLIIGWKAGK
jgi:DNA-binding Lrp family transcriptional regulator